MAMALAVYAGALRSGLNEPDVRTLTFATLMIANLALIVANRSLTRSVLEDWRTPNLALWILASNTLGVLAAVLFVPFLRDLFRVAMPHPDDVLVIVGAGLASLAWMEGVKRAARPAAQSGARPS
jgi:Ca2+-transporting ATPase